MTSITLGTNTYGLVLLPTCVAPSDIAIGMSDAVAVISSPYAPAQVQTQAWPGADAWDLQITLPPLSNANAADWEGFLAELRGALNVFQAGDPRRTKPLGVARGVPVAAAGNTALSTSLLTTGWTPNIQRLLMRGDMLQVGYRLHRVCETVVSDGSGNCTIPVWPVLREVPAGSAPIILKNPIGVFRLAQNRRESNASRQRLTAISFRAAEVR
jgi:hypothetical protein